MGERRALEAELQRVREESARLRARPAPAAVRGVRVGTQLPLLDFSSERVSGSSPDAERIGLFKRLFRGREDVYAVRCLGQARDGAVLWRLTQ